MLLLFLWSFSIFMICPTESPTAHDLHLSRCEINYDIATSAVQISISIFIDDLELALAERGTTGLLLLTQEESPEAEAFIAEYLKDKLRINIDNERKAPLYLGKEMGEDIFAAWFYLEIADIKPTDFIKVEYDLLMEIFNDQRNIVKISYDDQKSDYFLLDHKNIMAQLNL